MCRTTRWENVKNRAEYLYNHDVVITAMSTAYAKALCEELDRIEEDKSGMVYDSVQCEEEWRASELYKKLLIDSGTWQSDIHEILLILGLGDHTRLTTTHQIIHGEVIPKLKTMMDYFDAVDKGMTKLRKEFGFE